MKSGPPIARHSTPGVVSAGRKSGPLARERARCSGDEGRPSRGLARPRVRRASPAPDPALRLAALRPSPGATGDRTATPTRPPRRRVTGAHRAGSARAVPIRSPAPPRGAALGGSSGRRRADPLAWRGGGARPRRLAWQTPAGTPARSAGSGRFCRPRRGRLAVAPANGRIYSGFRGARGLLTCRCGPASLGSAAGSRAARPGS